jgi:hypothetical protein
MWRMAALPPGAPGKSVRVLVRLEGDPFDENQLQHPIRVIVDSGNPRAASLLAYLSEGEFAAARSIGDALMVDADDMLAEKLQDPAAAAIAGYFLLRAGNTRRLAWASNLDRWMEWLSDGAVIHAWYRLQSGDHDRNAIRTSLLEAVRRGCPVYTEGLKLLHDGLAILNSQSEDKDKEVHSALFAVRNFLQLVDGASPTTTWPVQTIDLPDFVRFGPQYVWPWQGNEKP